MNAETITLVHEHGNIVLPDTALVVALDDTGHDLFASTHPVFGLGGCAFLVRDYGHLIDDPWREMKNLYFAGSDIALHAAKLHSPTAEQMQALQTFFSNLPFFRFAVMSAETMTSETQHSLLKIACRSILDRIAEISKWAQPSEVAIVIESSQRIEQDLILGLSEYRMSDGDVEFEPKTFLLSKSANISFLEVADFVVHTAGSQIRGRLKGKYRIRKDFAAVFFSVDQRLSSYVELLSVRDMHTNSN
jgi:Protein of unknown function (DUF3800)